MSSQEIVKAVITAAVIGLPVFYANSQDKRIEDFAKSQDARLAEIKDMLNQQSGDLKAQIATLQEQVVALRIKVR